MYLRSRPPIAQWRHPACGRSLPRARSTTRTVRATCIHNPGFITGTSGLYKKFAITEKHSASSSAPQAFNAVQSPELERRELQPDQPLHLRKSYRQDRRRPQHAVLAQAVLLVRAESQKINPPGKPGGFFICACSDHPRQALLARHPLLAAENLRPHLNHSRQQRE